ncbi:MAG: hypothetical protein ACK4YU_15185, partial [Paracoccus sp. (in: a-proteobacteria)]
MRAALALLLMAGAAQADLMADEASVLPRILSAVPVEISDSHIGQERAVLLYDAQAGAADLVILVGAPDDRAGEVLMLARGLVWAGTMAGQVPYLQVTANGSLQVMSMQTAIGRSPWEEVMTLAERDGQILVA